MNNIKKSKKKYHYLIVGAGLYGSTFAYEAKKKGYTSLVIEKRNHIGGNIYTERIEGIQVHKYGAHIFHTNNEMIWKYINQFATFSNFINTPIANFHDELYNLPFNMFTFNKLWGVKTPKEAKDKLYEQIECYKDIKPTNLKEQALKLVGEDIFNKLIKGYTEKQWGRKCEELPPFIITRLPLRFTYDNNYFNCRYQGIPYGGYTKIIKEMLLGIDIKLNSNFFNNKEYYIELADKIVFTGMIDEFYAYCYGKLDYRSLVFVDKKIETDDFQGVAVMNYTDKETPYTRIIEHKHFEKITSLTTIITKEFPVEKKNDNEPYYPINDDENNALFNKYQELVKGEENVIFGGRLGTYSYFDMDQVILTALNASKKEFNK